MPTSYRADELTIEGLRDITRYALDVTGAEHVEVVAERTRGILWVNINGVCALRICRIKEMVVEKHGFRKPPTPRPATKQGAQNG